MRKSLLAALALGGAVACGTDVSTAPVSGASATANTGKAFGLSNGNGIGTGTANTMGYYPGWRRTDGAQKGEFVPLNCAPRRSAQGSAVIGPAGGVLDIGTHRLIVPAGALTRKVRISGTVPADRPFQVDLQPHGLQFRKAAGLILDASSCRDVPAIVYLIDQYTVSPPIASFYSNWWKAIAAPIWHFSGYMVYLGDRGEGDETSTR